MEGTTAGGVARHSPTPAPIKPGVACNKEKGVSGLKAKEGKVAFERLTQSGTRTAYTVGLEGGLAESRGLTQIKGGRAVPPASLTV